MTVDDRCRAPEDTLAEFECLGLALAGTAQDLSRGRFNWPTLTRNRRPVYLAADAAVLVLVMVILGVLLRRKPKAPSAVRVVV